MSEPSELLKRYEPVLRFTRGERFFPMDVEQYVNSSSLWVHRPASGLEKIYGEGELSLDRLAETRLEPFDSIQYIKFIEPLNIAELATYQVQQTLSKEARDQAFHAGFGRLARVGYTARLLDAIFSISLLARGRVPGDTAAAAAVTYKRLQSESERYLYYGRVVEQDGWLVLQYWFFYAFNNWRSGFSGVNDHESDWEMICIYLYKADADWKPEWIAYASHDFSGDDLRRRWDDPELEKLSEHPIVHVGAGSHASYFQAGEYLTELELPLLSPLALSWRRIREAWARLLRLDEPGSKPEEELFRIPFVDYARSDGISIGPMQARQWAEPVVISPAPVWVRGYRGLWGLWARDPVMGENAPAGPMYERSGKVRRSWYDPIGWAGLDKQVPPNRATDKAEQRQHAIEQRQDALKISIAEKARELRDLGIEAEAIMDQPHMKNLYAEHNKKIAKLSRELETLRAQLSAEGALREALTNYGTRLGSGYKVDPRAHIRRAHRPTSKVGLRLSRIAEAWAAISIGLMLFAFVGIVVFARHYLLIGTISMMAVVAIIEAIFRRKLGILLSWVTNALAVAAGLVLIYQFFWPMVIGVVILAGAYLMLDNLRELWS
jgi:hypothetical protein